MSIIEHRVRDTPAFVAHAVNELAEAGLRASWSAHAGDLGRAVPGTLTIDDGHDQHPFPAIAAATVNASDITLLPHDERTILITERVSDARAGQLRERGWGGFVDSAGNASLRSSGIVIEIRGRRAAGPTSTPSAAAPFTRAGLPVTFALLASAEHFGTTPAQRALAETSGTSLGTVNRVLRALRDRTPPMVEGKRNNLLRRDALEREWISAYSAQQPTAWPEERFTSDLWATPNDVLDAVLPEGALFGSEVAAARLGAPIRPATALIHVDTDDRARRELIRRGRLRKDEHGTIRLRPALWRTPPVPTVDHTVPRLLIRADLLLEDDPRTDEISAEFAHGER
ncbi:type IV toxin-antitoxin system AbiEi family antitoxin [Brevibacterium spongiae]|uniref:Uncharacterized protein n=1 Tax=Brevibacterium spongiae TaxID=2909672 RepID=A0ABY5SSM6_9MICO|nr:type IV toxin-antitoxin system AbiEi family antitoxin [Brevibacterium spongiae]UVI36881.1 hypothetical protein L1F31_04290 [Brevibacterium spongiae]